MSLAQFLQSLGQSIITNPNPEPTRNIDSAKAAAVVNQNNVAPALQPKPLIPPDTWYGRNVQPVVASDFLSSLGKGIGRFAQLQAAQGNPYPFSQRDYQPELVAQFNREDFDGEQNNLQRALAEQEAARQRESHMWDVQTASDAYDRREDIRQTGDEKRFALQMQAARERAANEDLLGEKKAQRDLDLELMKVGIPLTGSTKEQMDVLAEYYAGQRREKALDSAAKRRDSHRETRSKEKLEGIKAQKELAEIESLKNERAFMDAHVKTADGWKLRTDFYEYDENGKPRLKKKVDGVDKAGVGKWKDR